MCQLAGVSRSGYYQWIRNLPAREARAQNDRRDHEIIMNHKKIRRIMNQCGLITKVRRANPYKKMTKVTHEHRTLPNHLNRRFTPGMPRQVLLTDITYLHYGNGQKAYLSCVKDSMTREIVSFHLSSSLKMDIAYKTIDKLMIHLPWHNSTL